MYQHISRKHSIVYLFSVLVLLQWFYAQVLHSAFSFTGSEQNKASPGGNHLGFPTGTEYTPGLYDFEVNGTSLTSLTLGCSHEN